MIAGKYKRQQLTAYSLKNINAVVTKKIVYIKIYLIIFYQYSKLKSYFIEKWMKGYEKLPKPISGLWNVSFCEICIWFLTGVINTLKGLTHPLFSKIK